MLLLNIKQLIWCNSYIGTTRKIWNNNMSCFVLGYKFDVYILNITYIHFLIFKSLYIIKNLAKRKKKIIFIISKLVWLKSRFIKRKKPFKYIYDNLRNLTVITLTNWIFGLLTNFKKVNKQKKVIPLEILPIAIFMLTDKITSEFDYLNIIHEAFLLRILNFGIVDTDQNPLIFDYAIPGNSKAYETTKFFYRMYMSYFFIYNLKIKSDFFVNLILKNIFKSK